MSGGSRRMGAIQQPSSSFLPPTTPGRCRYCRCTDERACPLGCWWVDLEHTVCSNPRCVQRFERFLSIRQNGHLGERKRDAFSRRPVRRRKA